MRGSRTRSADPFRCDHLNIRMGEPHGRGERRGGGPGGLSQDGEDRKDRLPPPPSYVIKTYLTFRLPLVVHWRGAALERTVSSVSFQTVRADFPHTAYRWSYGRGLRGVGHCSLQTMQANLRKAFMGPLPLLEPATLSAASLHPACDTAAIRSCPTG